MTLKLVKAAVVKQIVVIFLTFCVKPFLLVYSGTQKVKLLAVPTQSKRTSLEKYLIVNGAIKLFVLASAYNLYLFNQILWTNIEFVAVGSYARHRMRITVDKTN